jgi:Polyketide cyclase / dehydrase and lipid transport
MLPTPSSKLQFTIIRDINASMVTVLTAESGMKAWIPLCRSAQWRPSGATLGVGAVRYIVLSGGIIAAERITAWEPVRELHYTFDESSIPLAAVTRNYVGITRVELLDSRCTRLTWSVHFDAPGRLKLLEPMLRASLRMFIGVMASRAARTSEVWPRY